MIENLQKTCCSLDCSSTLHATEVPVEAGSLAAAGPGYYPPQPGIDGHQRHCKQALPHSHACLFQTTW